MGWGGYPNIHSSSHDSFCFVLIPNTIRYDTLAVLIEMYLPFY